MQLSDNVVHISVIDLSEITVNEIFTFKNNSMNYTFNILDFNTDLIGINIIQKFGSRIPGFRIRMVRKIDHAANEVFKRIKRPC